jgi:large subunit ribosomal protein L3
MKEFKKGILGKKLGMSQLFDKETGVRLPVTLIECGPCSVLQIKTTDKDGYNAILLGYEDKKVNACNKPEQGFFNKNELKPKKFVKEIRLNEEEIKNYKVGDTVNVDLFQNGQFIDVSGISKGSGFTGVMKRHNFHGAPAKAHEYKRHGGSIGTNLTPGRVLPGRKMPGQHGNQKTTVMNLKIVFMDVENNILGVSGGIPGSKDGYVVLKEAQKRLAPTGIVIQKPEVVATEEKKTPAKKKK